MKALLLNPPADRGVRQVREGRCMQRAGAWTAIWSPISLATIGAVLRENGFEVKIIDAIVECVNFEALETIVKNYQPRITIINAATPSIESDLSTCRIIKRIDSKITTAIIGIHGTALAGECLAMQPDLDCVIRGEPEMTALELCCAVRDSKALNGVTGLSFRKQQQPIDNPDRAYIENLDTLPFPAWDLVERDKYRMPFTRKKFLLAATSRGCPYQCVFCADKAYYGTKLRLRSPKRIVDELEWIGQQFQIKDFLFWSESFTINLDFAKAVADEIFQRKLGIQWVCNSRVDNVDEELLQKIKRAGCWMIGFGIESGNQAVLDSVKKGIHIQDTIRAIELSKRAGLEVTAHCVLGFPADTKETILQTIEFVKKLALDYAQFYCAVPFPGSELYKLAQENNWICSADWRRFEQNFSVLNTPRLRAEEIMRIRNFAYRSFYFRPKIIGNVLRRIKTPVQFFQLLKGVVDFFDWI